MPAYITAPPEITPRTLLVSGRPNHSWGSYNDRAPTTKMQVTSVAGSGTVATIGVIVIEGNYQNVVVGGTISIQGTQTSSGAFNVTNATIASVSINATTGVGTITFASATSVSTANDSGFAYAPIPIVYEALTTTPTAGKQFAIAHSQIQRGLSGAILFTGAPATWTGLVQGADVDQDSAYTTAVTLTQANGANGASWSAADFNFNWVRVVVSGTGGTSPGVAASVQTS
jgi:hypothetical protein